MRTESPAAALSFPNIVEFISYGGISIGMLNPLGCVPTAADEDCTCAMLERRCGESSPQRLTRLAQAIDKALTADIFTDEIDC